MSYIKMRDNGNNVAFFSCPACLESHYIRTDVWDYNDDPYSPTVTPSILVQSANADGPTICHSYIKNGDIQFLSDCTHRLAGQTVPLPPATYARPHP